MKTTSLTPRFTGLKAAAAATGLILALGAVWNANASPDLNRVAVPANTISKGSVITESDLMWVNADEVTTNSYSLTEARQLVGQEATRNLRAGVPVNTTYVQLPPETRNGNIVTLTYNIPGLEVTSTGQALQDGYKGERIRVISHAGDKVIVGTVIAENMVSVAN